MNIDIPEQAKVSDILAAVRSLEEGGHIYCSSERHFSLLKICLIKLQKSDINIYLLDEHGFTLKQVSAKKKTAPAGAAAEASAAPAVKPFPSVARNHPTEAEPAIIGSARDEPASSVSVSRPISKPAKTVQEGLSQPQISAVRDLEQSLRRCKELGLLLIGFSDGLVAVPEALGYGADAISSADALEVESFDAYRGYESDDE